MAVTKVQLSGATTGKNIKVAATATAGTLIHTAHATNIDELVLWVANTSALDVKLTIEFGGVASPDDHIEKTIPAETGLVLIIPGLTLTNSLVVRAFAATTNVLVVNGYVNQHS